METVVENVTEVVEILKVPLVAPAAIVTLGGTDATDGLLLESVTCAPPTGAGELRMTVPIDVLPAVTATGLSVRPGGSGDLYLNPITNAAQFVAIAELAVAP
jgi:hypothetical protein